MSELALALHMAGSHVEYGIVCEDRVIASKNLPVQDASLCAVLPHLEHAIPLLADQVGVTLGQITGIAIGICAIADGGASVLSTHGKYDDAVGFRFDQWSDRVFGLPCRVENDTRLALLGEHFAGAIKGVDDAVLVMLGTRIGGAVLLGGRLLHSRGHAAAGLGHITVVWNGRVCSCGNRGCAEAEASRVALNAICRERPGFMQSLLARSPDSIGFRRLFRAVDAGDPIAIEVLDRCIAIWSALTMSLIHAYDPQAIVFGGGVMKRHQIILPRIAVHVRAHACVHRGSVRVARASLGSSAALLGALPLLRGHD